MNCNCLEQLSPAFFGPRTGWGRWGTPCTDEQVCTLLHECTHACVSTMLLFVHVCKCSCMVFAQVQARAHVHAQTVAQCLSGHACTHAHAQIAMLIQACWSARSAANGLCQGECVQGGWTSVSAAQSGSGHGPAQGRRLGVEDLRFRTLFGGMGLWCSALTGQKQFIAT